MVRPIVRFSMIRFFSVLAFVTLSFVSSAQTAQTSKADSLNAAIVKLQTDVAHIKLNLGRVEKRFKTGILISTVGYTTVITGGLMLGRKHDELGKALLITGGVTGVTGTILMVDAFRFLGIASGKKRR